MTRAIRNLIRFIAAGLIFFGTLQIGLEFARQHLHESEARVGQYLIGLLLVVLGIISFAFSSKAAAFLTDEDDGDDCELPPPSAE
ncbi:MAG: hypothetical protein ACTHLW_16855 [Verrucomicrobiota bacterium]